MGNDALKQKLMSIQSDIESAISMCDGYASEDAGSEGMESDMPSKPMPSSGGKNRGLDVIVAAIKNKKK